jgi:succinate--hydroxymethylglutarate CoA-transferase
MVNEIAHPTAGPMRVSDATEVVPHGALRSAPPVLGQHTDFVLTTDLGLPLDEVQRLRAKGIV